MATQLMSAAGLQGQVRLRFSAKAPSPSRAWTSAAIFGAVIGLIGFFITRSGLRKYQAKRKARREQILREKEAS